MIDGGYEFMLFISDISQAHKKVLRARFAITWYTATEAALYIALLSTKQEFPAVLLLSVRQSFNFLALLKEQTIFCSPHRLQISAPRMEHNFRYFSHHSRTIEMSVKSQYIIIASSQTLPQHFLTKLENQFCWLPFHCYSTQIHKYWLLKALDSVLSFEFYTKFRLFSIEGSEIC